LCPDRSAPQIRPLEFSNIQDDRGSQARGSFGVGCPLPLYQLTSANHYRNRPAAANNHASHHTGA
jgi:hypothetical protein